MNLQVLVIVWLLCAGAAYAIAKGRGLSDPIAIGVAGFLFGPFGVLYALIAAPKTDAEIMPPSVWVAVPAPPVAGSLPDRLAQLDAARVAGLITDVEYATKRSEIIAGH